MKMDLVGAGKDALSHVLCMVTASVSFLSYDKIPEMVDLKGGKVCFDLLFQRFQSAGLAALFQGIR